MAAAAPAARASWSDVRTLLERLPNLLRFAEKLLDVRLAGELDARELERLRKGLTCALLAVQRSEDVFQIALTRVEVRIPNALERTAEP